MSAATKLRLVRLAQRGDADALGEWVWSGAPIEDAFDLARDALPDFDADDAEELLSRVAEMSRTVAALTGLDLVAEVLDALQEQEDAGVDAEGFEPPDLDSAWGGEEPSMLDTVATSNMQSAYSLGRVQEDEGSDEWWEYVAQEGACEVCGPLGGTQAPQDDGIWSDRIPPLHPNCVCVLQAIPPQKVQAMPEDVPEESRGRRGWGNPRVRFDPDLSDKPAALLPLYHDKLRNLRRSE